MDDDVSMFVIDCHVHSLGTESANDILKGLDAAGINMAIIFSPYPAHSYGRIIPKASAGVTRHMEFSCSGVSVERQKEAIKFVASLQREAPDRIVAFAWLEPRLKDADKILEWAVTSEEIKGVKMIPDHWYPYDEFMYPIYKKAEALKIPIIFHSGILFGFKDSSRFCRPVNYEVLLSFPSLRFALAHVSWPWVDESIALWGRFRAALGEIEGANEIQMFIDITPGTPLIYRKETLQKLIAYGAEDYMLFGTDCIANNMDVGRQHIERDITILKHLIGVSDEVISKIMGKNALRFLGVTK
ncbi:amidohydrolase family protein [Candidatus Bathyarchaeota archaeon]|nr:amidohydrolase family protein [Candidatus Bathyarchaeota archaeon]